LKTGHDRRGGTYDQSDRVDAAVGSQGAIQVYDKWESFNTFAGADQPIDPYQFLIGYYGGGNNANRHLISVVARENHQTKNYESRTIPVTLALVDELKRQPRRSYISVNGIRSSVQFLNRFSGCSR
jgi:hypothetical protein